jgi:nitroreductase
VDLSEIMRTQHACRYFRPDPVPDEVLWRAVEMARFAPNGGNRNAVRLVFVRDPRSKRALGALYLPLWREVTAAVRSGQTAMTTPTGHHRSTQLGFSNPEKALVDGDHFAEHFGEHPLIIVVCVDIAETHPTDTELDRLSIVGGASVYPLAQNLCLALRSEGVATSLTTLLVAREPQVKRLLGIPGQLSTACHIAAGYPERPFPTRLRRAAVDEIALIDTYGQPLDLAGADAGGA